MPRFQHIICFLYVLVRLQSFLYDTDHFQYDCLHYFSINFDIRGVIKYCIRPVNDHNPTVIDVLNIDHQTFTFDELYRLHVTSHHILLWSSSIDLAERYQYYVDQPIQSTQLNELFFNCTPPWFGSHCQYSFTLDSNFDKSTLNVQQDSHMTNAITHRTCYTLLECDRGPAPMCLDWREICNDRIDCLNNGVDESQCFELELNECNENEYRCHNGLCIPKIFWNVHSYEAECLDKSDLFIPSNCPNSYIQWHTFACAEYACRPDEGQFPCGDGQCVEDFDKCENGRHLLLTESLSIQGNLSYDCWFAMVCLSKITDHVNKISCDEFTIPSQILSRLGTCEYPIQFPTIPVLLGHVHFLYHPKEIFNISIELSLVPDYICYDEKLCDYLTPTFHHGNLTCRYGYEMGLGSNVEVNDWKSIIDLVKPHFRGCKTHHYHEIDLHSSSMYMCKNSSKYISKHRLIDGISDCALDDDEEVSELYCSLNQPYRFQCLDETQCKSIVLLQNLCSTEKKKNVDDILFYEICDRVVDLIPMIINGRNHSDETDCEYWPCNNIYTRCDGFWSCTYGDDEENCWRPICDKGFLPCISIQNSTLMCLPANQVSDGIIDCLGASDEQEYCRKSDDIRRTFGFYCQNNRTCIENENVCDGHEDCPLGDDENFCSNHSEPCRSSGYDNLTHEQYILCEIGSGKMNSFSLETLLIYPLSPNMERHPVPNQQNEWQKKFSTDDFGQFTICNYGLYVYERLGSDNITYVCFCPPNYYGDHCEYQNQRVSLTLILGFVQYVMIYSIVITLIEDDDDQQEIHSYHQLTQALLSKCDQSLDIYLLYSIRPKNDSKKYGIRIDAFDKSSLNYLASWYLKIPFLFLPVNRLAALLTLPTYRALSPGHCPLRCYKGTCMKYLNKERYFCRCHSGWSGAKCHIQIDCSICSSSSICVGSIRNRSICVCPIGNFGSRCLLQQSCPPHFCENNGKCVVLDDRMIDDSYTCMCSESFYGTRCESTKSKIEVSFQNIEVSSHIFAYIYSEIEFGQPRLDYVLFKKVNMFQSIVTVYSLMDFGIVILKIDASYYLTVLQQVKVSNISTTISPKQRCIPFQELFTSEVLALPRIHRLKSYQRPCQNNLDLQCFMDESYICLCTKERQTNCFLFDTNMTMTCQGNLYCENGGVCLQDQWICPQSIICVCVDCFFGDRCQFYAKGIGLTLDDMLRYVIQPNLTFFDQSIIIKLSAIFTLIIFVIGLLNSFFAYLVFNHQNSRKVGCGIYLYLSSIVSALVVTMLITKLWFVILTHINQKINRSALSGGCVFIEIGLKLFLHISNWLHACVSIERAIAVCKGVRFNKRQSRCIARWICRFLPFVILGSISYEFVYRDLFDDYEEQRIWCVFHYSASIERYSTATQLFHFIAPFLSNLFSALFLVITMARQRATIRTHKSYERQLLEQFNEHKQLVVSPIVLVIVSCPRLLISMFSGCVKASRNPWLYLSGYFISFIPPAFVFFIFVLPSTAYKKQFQEWINTWRRRITA